MDITDFILTLLCFHIFVFFFLTFIDYFFIYFFIFLILVHDALIFFNSFYVDDLIYCIAYI